MSWRAFTLILFSGAMALGCPKKTAPGDPPPAGDGGPGGEPLDCAAYPTCGVDTPCEAGGECFSLAPCSDPICINGVEACQKVCGKPECAVMESFPMQLSCG